MIIKTATIIALLILSVACDKVCKKTTDDSATIQNMTGRILTLQVCKGQGYGSAEVTVQQSAISADYSLGSHEASEIKGGFDLNSCKSVKDDSMKMGISLTAESFDDVKLCTDATNGKNVIVETHQLCPTDYLEQTEAATCTVL